MYEDRTFEMKISALTAVWNCRDAATGAVIRVRSKTHEDIEHSVQEGGSRDGTLDVLVGLAAPAMHVESNRATGAVIGLMQSDDLFAAPDILAQVADALA
jgi:glycosyltransferase